MKKQQVEVLLHLLTIQKTQLVVMQHLVSTMYIIGVTEQLIQLLQVEEAQVILEAQSITLML